MRILCLFLPRFGIQLLQRDHPELRSQTLALLQGCGDSAVVTATSATGVVYGTTAGQARQAAPSARFMHDNASDCLDELDRLACIIRSSATPLVEVGGRDHLFVDMEGLAARFATEANAASRTASMIQECTGFEVRAAVTATRSSALRAARSSRHSFQILEQDLQGAETVPAERDETLTTVFHVPQGEDSGAVDRTLLRQMSRLGDVLEARGRGYRSIEVQLTTAGEGLSVKLRPAAPMYSGDEIARAWNALRPDVKLAGVDEVAVRCSGPAPDTRVAARAAVPRRSAAPRVSRPRQMHLQASA